MNDIDRSVDTFDFALRRRFRWINVQVDEALLSTTFNSMKKSEEISVEDYVKRITAMNEVFNDESYKRIFKTPEDFYVGPAYFKGLFNGESMDNIWVNKVEPLLREYVRGREEADDFIKDCWEALCESEKSEETDAEPSSDSQDEGIDNDESTERKE